MYRDASSYTPIPLQVDAKDKLYMGGLLIGKLNLMDDTAGTVMEVVEPPLGSAFFGLDADGAAAPYVLSQNSFTQVLHDDFGNRYVGSRFFDSTYISIGNLNLFLDDQNPQQLSYFLLKIDTNDSIHWLNVYDTECAYYPDMRFDPNGNLVFSSIYFNAFNANPNGPGIPLSHTDLSDFFVMKINVLDGLTEWAVSFQGEGRVSAAVNEIDVNGNIYAAGWYRGFFDLDPGPAVNLVYADSTENLLATDAFLVKLDSNGSYQWAKAMRGSGPALSSNVVESNGRLYWSGWVTDDQYLWPGNGMPAFFAPNTNGFLYSFDAQGNSLRGGRLETNSATNYSFINDMSRDTAGNVFFITTFDGEVDLSPSPSEAIRVDAESESQSALVKVDEDLRIIDYRVLGSAFSEVRTERLHIDRWDQIYLHGRFRGGANFHPSPDSLDTLYSDFEQSYRYFITKWVQCTTKVDSIVIDEVCGGFKSFSGTEIWREPGFYHDTLTNQRGCDSVVVAELKKVIDNTAYREDEHLFTKMSGAEYQWYECTNLGLEAVQGANDSVFYGEVGKAFCVVITTDSCVDTSACKTIYPLGLDEEDDYTFQVYPNPSDGQFQLRWSQVRSGRLTLYSLHGTCVFKQEFTGDYLELDGTLSPGVYLLNWEDVDGSLRRQTLIRTR